MFWVFAWVWGVYRQRDCVCLWSPPNLPDTFPGGTLFIGTPERSCTESSPECVTITGDVSRTFLREFSRFITTPSTLKYTLEAVQYNPESILSEGGDGPLANFLKLRGETWEENPERSTADTTLPPLGLYQTVTVKA